MSYNTIVGKILSNKNWLWNQNRYALFCHTAITCLVTGLCVVTYLDYSLIMPVLKRFNTIHLKNNFGPGRDLAMSYQHQHLAVITWQCVSGRSVTSGCKRSTQGTYQSERGYVNVMITCMTFLCEPLSRAISSTRTRACLLANPFLVSAYSYYHKHGMG